MKLRFEDNLDYQLAAVESVAGLFRGQEINRTEFTVTYRSIDSRQNSFGVTEKELGIGNKLELLDEEILENLRDIQLKNGLLPSEFLTGGDFTVEMETGTGKTYVYLRTILELNKRYGFTKFVIVVPSVAIKEGTHKTLQITREHFENIYPMAKGYEYFQYDSTKPGNVRNFATSPNIQIMIVTVGAINKKDVNNLYKISEKTGGEKPIDLVCATNPIIIVDEPQSVDGGMTGRGKEALGAMNPLCTLRYSATHVDRHHMVYRLDAVDAYKRELVKQIEVASLEVVADNNRPYVKLMSTENRHGAITAKIEADALSGGRIKRQIFTVEDGDDLQQETGRKLYENFRIDTITVGKTNQAMKLSMPGGEALLHPGDEVGGVNQDELKRLMIRRTIKEHLDKEKRFASQGHEVKVLSLFFVDSVDFYRQYNEDGNIVKGKYALMFEKEYRGLADDPDYQALFEEVDLVAGIDEVHNGYFSIDKKGGWTETSENNQTNRDNAERAYNLIMKEKEDLLSFSSNLKFIFSHSALKEGWDNPNVFQICALRNIGKERERRQTLGRGLRLCVNQKGERLHGFDLNTLTVIATENYEQFADNLQKEIEADTGIRFDVVEKHQFANISVTFEDGKTSLLGMSKSEKIWALLKQNDYIDSKGKVLDSLRTALKDDTTILSEEFSEQEEGVKEILRKLTGKLDIKNADERLVIGTRKAVLESEEFRALWNRIKHKTTYRVEFDNTKLINECIDAISKGPGITKTRAQFRVADIAIGKSGVKARETSASGFISIRENDIELPDILTDLEEKTKLTRKSLVKILIGCRRLLDFKKNPQEFIDLASEAINRAKRLALVDGIKYRRIGDDCYYAQELFEEKELKGYLKNTIETQKSVYKHVVYDSTGVERRFAEELEKIDSVKVYAKLPKWFKVSTPLGSYTPDWAVLIENEGQEKLFFVVETKSSGWWDELRYKEDARTACGKAHFTAIAQGENPAIYIKATEADDLMKEAQTGVPNR